jgi:SAM-dependent methyltransferase
MSKPGGPLAAAATWDLVADSYTQHIVPVFENYAREALKLAAVPPASEIVDVATGPGTLALVAAELGHTVSAVDFSRGMMDKLKAASSARKLKVETKVCDGQALELPADRFQAAFSMFGLIFYPSRARGFSELYRVLKPGGRAVVASWAPQEKLPFMSAVFGSLAELLPNSPPPPRVLDTPETCITEMATAGFSDVRVEQVSFAFESPTLAEFWAWFPSSCAAIAALPKSLGADYEPLMAKLSARVLERMGPGPLKVEMPALLTVGTKT